MRDTVKVRINKHEEKRRAEARIQEDDPNADQRKKEHEDHVAHKDRSGLRGHLHRVHPRVKQKSVHRSGHDCVGTCMCVSYRYFVQSPIDIENIQKTLLHATERSLRYLHITN